MSSKFLDVFRKCNSAFLPEGVQIVGHVIKVNERKGPQTFPSSELGGAPAVGDKVTLLLERVETPLGDMQLTPNESHEGNRTEAIWREIRTAHAEGRRIKGRILNSVNAGFAVGVGGYVAFLPTSRLQGTLKVGVIYDFKVMSLVESNRNLVLTCEQQHNAEPEILRWRSAFPAAAAMAAKRAALSRGSKPSQSSGDMEATGAGEGAATSGTRSLLAMAQAVALRRKTAEAASVGTSQLGQSSSADMSSAAHDGEPASDLRGATPP